MRTGEALSRLIAGYGIDTVFGIAGVHNVELFRGFAESGLRLVRPRHEQGAGFMADGYARASGRAAACYVITGPGLTNLMTPLAQAYSDSVPVLAVASTLDRADLGQRRGRLHEAIDQRGAAAAILDFAATATAPHDVPELLGRALAGQAAGRPRPAYLEIPMDVLASEAGSGWEPRPLPARPEPARDAIEAASRLVVAAKRPVIIAGGGAVAAAPALLELAQLIASPVVTTVAGKGIIADGHALALGATLPQEATRQRLEAADVVLAIGTELAETDHWLPRHLPMTGPLIRIDIDPARLADAHPAAVPILADAAAATAALIEALGIGRRHAGAASAEVAAIKARLRAEEAPLRRRHRAVLEAVRRSLPEDAIVASDMTQIAYSANEIFPAERPRCWLHPVGFGTLGYAVPAAIGAQLACPGRAVAALVGDYGFQYTMNELATAAELRLPVIVLLWNNRALGEIRDDMTRRGVAPLGTDAPGPDFAPLAQAFGCAYARPATPAAIEAAVGAAIGRDRPTVVELVEEMF